MDIIELDHAHDVNDDHFPALNKLVQASFDAARNTGPLFRTNANHNVPNATVTVDGVPGEVERHLFDVYLNALPATTPEMRQHYNCSTCRAFMNSLGDLVTVTPDGKIVSAFWSFAGAGFYQSGVDAVREIVEKSKITAAFFTKEDMLGTRHTGDWTHFAVDVPVALQWRRVDFTAGQWIAHSKERRRMALAALADIKVNVLTEALRVLKADVLNMSEKFTGPIQWLLDLHNRPKGPVGENILWRAVASAPESYFHIRSGVLMTLLEDIENGLSFEAIRDRFNKKTHGLNYMRAQAAPTAGAIAHAEKLVADMGIARSFERRFARLDEVRKIWEPRKAEAQQSQVGGGVFGHIKAKDAPAEIGVTLPPTTMTWEKFKEKVLGEVYQLEFLVPAHGHFTGLTTAVHADAPPILRWDREDDRYPVSMYIYDQGSQALSWSLPPNTWVTVNAIVPSGREEGKAMIVVLDGAKDVRTNQGNGIFPDSLRPELHAVRSVVEAYSKAAEISGREEASANGYAIMKGQLGIRLRAFDGKHWNTYVLDRFE